MAGQPSFPLYDRVLGGRLALILKGYRDRGMSTYEAHRQLIADHGITPSHRTVARWMAGESGAPEELAEASK